jgi:hypothetical protein
LWAVAACDAVLAALFVPLAAANQSAPAGGFAAFHHFYTALGWATPLLLFAAAADLAAGAVGRSRAVLRVGRAIQWAACAALTVRASSLVLLSFIVPNDSGSATLLFVTGNLLFVPAALAGAGGQLLRRSAGPTGAWR